MATGENKDGKKYNGNIRQGKGKRKEKINWPRKKKKDVNSEEEMIQKLREAYQNIDPLKIQSFGNFPLSQKTLKGLKDSGYLKPTEIQRECLGLALQGADILGAAKTGSGKTLAFLVPVMEILFCKQWTRIDGLGALIITPTRELAYQIFETLRKVGRYHDLSGGLIIGGKDLHFEKKRMDQCNVVICTPGRLLQHMDENPLFDCSNMQVLVLDEADRCLDMGFETTMNSIIENLPPKRQTLLFSATQTKSVRDLARLSLKDPMYVSVHEHAKYSTPESLQQSYVVCELHEKLDMLWSFIRNHLKQKILIFMSSCKQVKYHYEVFCRLRPGTSLLALYGTLHQLRRMSIYESFCRKSNAVLFATDIAARGLDFPEVNWVVQLDCPEDANTYIHRAGRTARYHKGGESLLVLLPSEEKGMLKQLTTKKIPINKIKINPKKLQSPQRKMEALLARDPSLKESAQRAFVSYVKAVFLMRNKDVFNVHALNTDEYARSLGLAIPPRIRFLQKLLKQQNSVPQEESQDDIAKSEQDEVEQDTKFNFQRDESDSELDILKVKRKNHELEDNLSLPEDDSESQEDSTKTKKKKKLMTKVAVAKKILKKKIVPNKKVVFNEEGEVVLDPAKEKASNLAREYETENIGGIDIEKAKQVLREEDKFDKLRFREKVKAKHREEKMKLKKAMEEQFKKEEEEEEEEEEVVVQPGDEETSEESGPDLSWLPDPDKVYSKRDDSQSEQRSDTSSEDEEELVHKPIPLKRKLPVNSQQWRKKHKQDEDNDDVPMDTGLSLCEDEELALQFLKNR